MIEYTYHSLPPNSRADIWILSLNPLKRPSEEYPNNRTVYRILKEDVEDIVYLPDCHMITITGTSKTIPYEDYAEKNTIYRDGISEVSEYTFFLSLDEEERKEALETINKIHSIKNYMKDE